MTAIAFDLDDTLYKEMHYVASGYRAVARELADATGADAEALAALIMRHRPVGFEHALEAIATSPSAGRFSVESMIETYRAHKPQIALSSGASEMLGELHRRGVPMVLITDGSTRHQRAKIEALGLYEYFDHILISEETGGDKTTDVPWKLMEEYYPGSRLIYLGDNLSKDFRIPNGRGWLTAMLADYRGENVFAQRFEKWPAANLPRIVLHSLAQVPQLCYT